MFIVDLHELHIRELLDRGDQRLRDVVLGAIGLADALQIDMQDAVGQVDAAVTHKTVPHGHQAGVLFGGVRSLEVLIHHRRDWVGRREDLA